MQLINDQSQTIREAYFKIETLNEQIEDLQNSGNNADAENEWCDEQEAYMEQFPIDQPDFIREVCDDEIKDQR